MTLTLSRDDAALTIVEAVSRSHLARQAIMSDASDMIAPGAVLLDADVGWEGDGPAPIEPVDNEDPSPAVP